MLRQSDMMRKILRDAKVELTDMFDRNFEQKGFFGTKWMPRKSEYAKNGKPRKGSLLIVSGRLRRSIRSTIQGTAVVFTSDAPYAALHNEGGQFTESVRAHTRTQNGKAQQVRAHSRTVNMPERRFIGNHKAVRTAMESIIRTNMADYFSELAKELKR
jgi:phage gpG-like protein